MRVPWQARARAQVANRLGVEQAAQLLEEACLLWMAFIADLLRELGDQLALTAAHFLWHLDDDGRVRPEYLQVVGTNTGRLASRHPNAQNLSPRMKPYFRPADPDRVFVYSDLSQAELRFVAQVSADEALRQAFVDGVDIHVATAEAMFGEDMTRSEEHTSELQSH